MSEINLAADFPASTDEAWRALVDKVLKGGDFERRLVTRTADGLRIAPLYTRDDALPSIAEESSRYGAAGMIGWDIRQRHAGPDSVSANTAILEDLAGGVTSILLQVASPGGHGIGYERAHLGRALEGVLLDVCPVALDAGEYTPDAAGGLLALWRDAGIDDAARRGALNYDPLGNLGATGALYHSLPRALAIAADLVATTLSMPGVTALRVNGHVWHAGGATEAEELGCVLAALVAYLRASEAAGIAPAVALPKIAVTLAVDADQFLSIAKLRAVRLLVERIAAASGASAEAGAVVVTAETSTRMMSRRDPWVNLLRTTIACASAAMGGAAAITVLPFTWALGIPDDFARRIARNTHHVLAEEAALARVADPAGGSWYVERLTRDLARKAWEIFQDIEREGGLGAALIAGSIAGRIERSAAARSALVAEGRMALTGASAFPRLGSDGVTVEPWPAKPLPIELNGVRVRPIPPIRLSEPFERLRDRADAFEAGRGVRPKVFVATIGSLATHAVRTTWIANFLAAGGIEAVTVDSDADQAELAKVLGGNGAGVACLCASDETYAEAGAAAVARIKTAGARRVYLAGRPRGQEAALLAAGVDAFIYAGVDATRVLGGLLDDLGAA